MQETYCGNVCEECLFREKLQCPGCKNGPGKAWRSECELAKCCSEKGHQACTTCSFRTSCGKLWGRKDEPERRLRRREAEQERRKRMAEKAQLLGKWLWILFWLVIPSNIAGIMTNETVAGLWPELNLPGQILQLAVLLIYGGILMKISCQEERYRNAGICCFLSAGANVLLTVMSVRVAPGWTLAVSIPAMILSLVGEYNEYGAHAEVTRDVDSDLSEKWTRLWKWYIRMYLGLFISIVIVWISSILGLLLALAALIGIFVVSVLKLVYLYRSAKRFREYSDSESERAF